MNTHSGFKAFLTFTIVLLIGIITSTYASAAITDEEIAHIVVTANTIDITAGKLALGKATNADVKKFADWMVNGHSSINTSAAALVAKLKVTPKDNDTSKDLAKGGEENVAHLTKLTGAEFDKAYISHEVAFHDTVLEALNKTLIPNAKNKELKETLIKSEAVIQGHVARAREIVANLNSKK